MADLLTRLREVSYFSDITHNDCVFDHLEGGGQSRNKVASFESERATLQYQIESLSEQNHRLQRDLETSTKKNIELQSLLMTAVRGKDAMTLKSQKLETEKATVEKDLQAMKMNLQRSSEEHNKVTLELQATKLKLQRSSEEHKKVKKNLREADQRAADLEKTLDSERKKSVRKGEEDVRQMKLQVKRVENEKINLLLSLDRAQETVSTIAQFIARTGNEWHTRDYVVPYHNWHGSFEYEDFETKTNLLIERFQFLNSALKNSNVFQFSIYRSFIVAFQKAIDVLCTHGFSHTKKGEDISIYTAYTKKDGIKKSDIDTVKPLTIDAFMCYKTTESVTKPSGGQMKFDLQIHREFENILCIYEGFDEDKRLKAKVLEGYGFHVFLDLTEHDLHRTRVLNRIGFNG
jgi:hypothetical protein